MMATAHSVDTPLQNNESTANGDRTNSVFTKNSVNELNAKIMDGQEDVDNENASADQTREVHGQGSVVDSEKKSECEEKVNLDLGLSSSETATETIFAKPSIPSLRSRHPFKIPCSPKDFSKRDNSIDADGHDQGEDESIKR